MIFLFSILFISSWKIWNNVSLTAVTAVRPQYFSEQIYHHQITRVIFCGLYCFWNSICDVLNRRNAIWVGPSRNKPEGVESQHLGDCWFLFVSLCSQKLFLKNRCLCADIVIFLKANVVFPIPGRKYTNHPYIVESI